MNAQLLIDSKGRHLKKLRLSLIDACNFRCTYCMPEDVHFHQKNEILKLEEIVTIVSTLEKYGLEEVRVTGGEPTLRQDFIDIMMALSAIPLKKLALTTNAHDLEQYLGDLKKTSCRTINVSIDSLKEDRFFQITKSNSLKKVIKSTLAARDAGFKVKVNCVMMKGVNDDEFHNFIDFSARENIEVRFLELMKIGVMRSLFDKKFIPAMAMIKAMNVNSDWTLLSVEKDSTSFNYKLKNGAQIGFIASESMPFCQNCSRLRLDPLGVLRGCLMSEEGYSLRNLSFEEYPLILKKVVNSKPMERIESTARPMYLMGG